jgi:hypothetical protein
MATLAMVGGSSECCIRDRRGADRRHVARGATRLSRELLERMGGHSGEVRVSLAWKHHERGRGVAGTASQQSRSLCTTDACTTARSARATRAPRGMRRCYGPSRRG